jgi:hypothetical protein
VARRRDYQRRGEQTIAALLEGFDGSGLTQAAFARQQGLSVSTLRFWLRKRRRRPRRGSPAARLVPVRITGSLAAPRPMIELDVGTGRRVHIPLDADREDLARLLPVIVAAC